MLNPLQNLRPHIRHVIAEVAATFGFTPDQLRGRHRCAQLALARHTAMYVARQCTGASYPLLGREFGYRDHTTIMYAVLKIDRLRALDGRLDEYLSQVLIPQANLPAISPQDSELQQLAKSVALVEAAVRPLAKELLTIRRGIERLTLGIEQPELQESQT